MSENAAAAGGGSAEGGGDGLGLPSTTGPLPGVLSRTSSNGRRGSDDWAPGVLEEPPGGGGAGAGAGEVTEDGTPVETPEDRAARLEGGDEEQEAAKPSKQQPAGSQKGKARQHIALEDLGPEGLMSEEQAIALASKVLGKPYTDAKTAVDALNGLLGGGRGRADAKVAEVREAASTTIQRWKGYAEGLRAELEAARGGKAAAKDEKAAEGGSIPADRQPGGAAGAASAKGLLEELGPQGWAYLENLYEEKGLQHALGFFAIKADERMERVLREREQAIEDRVLAKIDPRLKPVEEVFEGSRMQREQLQATVDLFGEVYDGSLGEDGASAFPELADPEATAEVARIWAETGKRDPRTQFSPMAVENAVYRFRASNPGWKAAGAKAETADPGSRAAAEGGGGVVGTGGRGVVRGSGVISGSGVPGHGLPAGKPRGAADDFDAAIRRQSAMKKELGFIPTDPNMLRRGA